MEWTPLAGPEDDGKGTIHDVDDPDDLVGKPWTYKLSIKGATALPIMVSSCFVQYEFFGSGGCVPHTTETVEADTHSPRLDYTCIHHVDRVTPAFIAWLRRPLEFSVWVAPHVTPPRAPVSTVNPNVLAGSGLGAEASLGRRITSRTLGPGMLISPTAGRSGTTAALGEEAGAGVSGETATISTAELAVLQSSLATARARIQALEQEVSDLRAAAAQEHTGAAATVSNGVSARPSLKIDTVPSSTGSPPQRNSSLASPRSRIAAAKAMDAALGVGVEPEMAAAAAAAGIVVPAATAGSVEASSEVPAVDGA